MISTDLQPSTFDLHIQTQYDNPNTIALASQHINVFIRWYEEQFNQTFKPELLTNYDLKLYRRHSLDEAKVTAATWNSRHWALGIYLTWIGSPDLMIGIDQKTGSAPSEKHRSLTEPEYHDLIRTCQREIRAEVTAFGNWTAVRDYAMCMVMVKAGLRVTECADLDLNDIILGERSGAIIVRDGKGGKMRKLAVESEVLRPALRAWLDVRGNFATTALFINARGARLTAHTIREIVKDLGCKINVPDLTPHWLRYTFAKMCERHGVPISTISAMLGHVSIDTTVRYLRSSLAELQSAVEW